MAVQFILGGAGTGKSYRLYRKMTDEAYNNQDKNYIAIVPEQYSMESQKEIIMAHKKHGAFNTEVVSFNRLAYRIFDEMNVDRLDIMDDLGKTLVLRRVLSKCVGDLEVYGKKINMPGFIEKMKSTISELEQYDISEGKLMEMTDSVSGRPSLVRKLKDISVIYSAFNRYNEKKRIPQEEVLSLLCDLIPQSLLVKNTNYFIDGYTGFTPIQKKVVDMLIQYAPNVTFSFTLPEDEANFTTYEKHDLFRLSKKTISDIKEVCMANGVEVLENNVIPYVDADGDKRSYRLKDSKEVAHIEQHIFRYSQGYKYDDEPSSISIHECENPRREAEFAAGYILDKIQKDESGTLKYSDFAIISADIETYYRYIGEELEKYGIPTFIDYKRDMSGNRFVDAFSSVIEIMENNYSYESVMHFLRLDILNLDRTDIDLFDNYIFEKGKKGKLSYEKIWFINEFSHDEQTAADEIKEKEQLHNESIENVRTAIYECVECVRNEMAASDCKSKVVAMYNFAVKYGFEERISLMAEELEKKGERLKALEYRQIYEKIIELFDRLVELLGDERINRKDFLQIIKDGFSCLKVGIIPATLDCVMVGDIERTRLKDVKKYVILIGADDSCIPKNTGGSGIISDAEREYLNEKSFELAPTSRDNIFIQKNYLYLAMAKPAMGLAVTYSRVSMDGRAKRPAYIIPLLKDMFVKLDVKDETYRGAEYCNILGIKDAVKYLADGFSNKTSDNSGEFEQVFALIKDKEDCRDVLENIVNAAFYKRQKEELEPEVAKILYGDRVISVTKLEKFANCAFSQFVENGLKLGERKKYELALYELGNLYHDALDLFFKNLKKECGNSIEKWKSVDENTRNLKIDEAVEQAVGIMKNDILREDVTGSYLKNRIRRITEKTVRALDYHIKSGEYVPYEFEYRVKHGIIDRVDMYENEDSAFVRVIDYKSGKKEYSLDDIYYGLSLQLMVYTKDALDRIRDEKKQKSVIPGGAYYFHIDDPLVNKTDFNKLKEKEAYLDRDEIAFKTQLKEYRLSGLSNASNTNLFAIDSGFRDATSSDVVSLRITASGDINKSDIKKAMSTDDFNTVLDYAANKSKEMSDRILDGDITVDPVNCEYCKFAGICNFDVTLGDKRKNLKENKSENILSDMADFNEMINKNQ